MVKVHADLHVLQILVFTKEIVILALNCTEKDALLVTMKNPANSVIRVIFYHKKMEGVTILALKLIALVVIQILSVPFVKMNYFCLTINACLPVIITIKLSPITLFQQFLVFILKIFALRVAIYCLTLEIKKIKRFVHQVASRDTFRITNPKNAKNAQKSQINQARSLQSFVGLLKKAIITIIVAITITIIAILILTVNVKVLAKVIVIII